MEGINWLNHTSEEFTLFCSALLAMEIGKQFQPFTAKGRDQGIDGWFEGKYGELEGAWRFQYKFHNVARKQGYNLIYTDLKNEISKIREEDFFVLVSNVELLPQEKTALEALFEQSLPSERRTLFEVWDGAKLFTLFVKFPMLALWLGDGFDTAQLQDYRIAFKSNLEVAEDEPSSLHNFFIARESDIEVLHTFLLGPETLMLITGEAGIGKTRMTIEFFHTVSKLEGWQTLVLLNRTIDFDKIKRALSGDIHSVILVDDAHTFMPEIIADIKKLADLSDGQIKLILTSRNLEAYTSLKLIKEYELGRIQRIQLEELSRADTQKLFQHELANHSYINYVDELTQISYGRPVLIVALFRAIKNGTPIAQVRQEGFLIQYVLNFFDSAVKTIVVETDAPRIQVKKLIQLVCLIEPFNYADQALIAKLAKASDLPAESVIFTLKLLRDKGFSTGRYEQSIRPDYYSDIILLEADAAMLVLQLPGFVEYINNIITNLSSLDEVKKQERSFLDELLAIYVSTITTKEDITAISQIFTTVAKIAYQKPKTAVEAINIYLTAIGDSKNVITQDYNNNVNYYYQSPESVHGRVKSMLIDLLHLKEYYEFVFTSVLKLFKLTKDDKLTSNVINFDRRDFIDKFKLRRQTFFLERFKHRVSVMDEEEAKLAIQCCKVFLKLDFTASAWDGASQHSITITTYFLPNAANIRKFRQKIIELLVKIYEQTSITQVRSLAFHELLDIPRGIFATSRNKTVYKGNQEIKLILEFLNSAITDLPSTLQKEVIDKIYWYKQWKIDSSFHSQLDEITRRMAPRNLTEQLVHLFSRSELGLPSNALEEVISKSKALIPSASADQLTQAINELVKDSPNQFPYLWTFLSVLQVDFPELAKDVYTKLWETNKPAIYQFGAPFLQQLYFRHLQLDFYWQSVNKLIAENVAGTDSLLLRVYGRIPDWETLLTTKDIDLIKRIADKKNAANNFDLYSAILTVIKVDLSTGTSLAISFLDRCGQREADMFFMFLADKHSQYYDTFRQLCLQHTFRLSVGYEIEISLNKIVLREGYIPVFDYFKRRYEIKKESVVANKSLLGYDWVPGGKHSHLFDNCDATEKPKFFVAIVDWYVETAFDSLEQFYAKDFLEYGQPSDFIDDKLFNFFNDLYSTHSTSHAKVERILECLETFHDKEMRLVELVLIIYSRSHEIFLDLNEIIKDIRYRCFAALTTMGVKSGTSGQPFEVDLELKKLLEMKLQDLQEYSPTYTFLKDVIKSVDRDIQSQYEKGNDTW
jgi:hypothetical protein